MRNRKLFIKNQTKTPDSNTCLNQAFCVVFIRRFKLKSNLITF